MYSGPLNFYKINDPLVKRAYKKWLLQRERCGNPKHVSYKDYGAKGIRVEYEAREFIIWYLEKLKTFTGTFPVVGRIDHCRNYSLDNIELIDRSANSKERHVRCGPTRPQIPVVAIDIRSGKEVGRYASICEAARSTGVRMGQVAKHVAGIVRAPNRRSKLTFRRVVATSAEQLT